MVIVTALNMTLHRGHFVHDTYVGFMFTTLAFILFMKLMPWMKFIIGKCWVWLMFKLGFCQKSDKRVRGILAWYMFCIVVGGGLLWAWYNK